MVEARTAFKRTVSTFDISVKKKKRLLYLKYNNARYIKCLPLILLFIILLGSRL